MKAECRPQRAQHEVVVPGLVDVPKYLVDDLAGQIESPDVRTQSCPCRKHLDAAFAALPNGYLLTRSLYGIFPQPSYFLAQKSCF